MLIGDGQIDVSGGSGSLGGGGGGSGGRLVNHYLQSYHYQKAREASIRWLGTFDIHGGLSGKNQ